MANRTPRGTSTAGTYLTDAEPPDEGQEQPKAETRKATKKVASEPEQQEIRFFEGSITKVNVDGNVVLSDHVAPGEQLRTQS